MSRRKAQSFSELQLADLPVGTIMLQWHEEYEEFVESWERKDDGWQIFDRVISTNKNDARFTDHMIWSPIAVYEIVYDPRED